MGRLEGKSVVITGAGSGIGRAASLMFTKEGAKLIAVDKTDAVDETVQAGARGGRHRRSGEGATPGSSRMSPASSARRCRPTASST